MSKSPFGYKRGLTPSSGDQLPVSLPGASPSGLSSQSKSEGPVKMTPLKGIRIQCPTEATVALPQGLQPAHQAPSQSSGSLHPLQEGEGGRKQMATPFQPCEVYSSCFNHFLLLVACLLEPAMSHCFNNSVVAPLHSFKNIYLVPSICQSLGGEKAK